MAASKLSFEHDKSGAHRVTYTTRHHMLWWRWEQGEYVCEGCGFKLAMQLFRPGTPNWLSMEHRALHKLVTGNTI